MRTGLSSSADVLDVFAPPVPPAAVERAEAFRRAAAGGARPPAPRRAASVVLLRDGAGGVELYLLHRHARMAFAPSVAAFPGGGVDPVDATSPHPVLACAVRETEEETTVVLRPEELAPWARWVTPVYEPRRYDTTFFLARLPDGQEARDVSGETEGAEWIRPHDVLRDRDSGSLSLLPPTWSILLELDGSADGASALDVAHGRRIVTVLPRLVRGGDGWTFGYEEVR